MQRQHPDPAPGEPVDSDLGLQGAGSARPHRGETAILAVVAAGGALGAAARFLIGEAWPAAPGSMPWATFGVNLLGCALLGVLMVLVSQVRTRHRLVRPFLATGVLGGFTTFSTYAVDIQRLVTEGHYGVALSYLGGTAVAGVLAVWATTRATRALVGRWRR